MRIQLRQGKQLFTVADLLPDVIVDPRVVVTGLEGHALLRDLTLEVESQLVVEDSVTSLPPDQLAGPSEPELGLVHRLFRDTELLDIIVHSLHAKVARVRVL